MTADPADGVPPPRPPSRLPKAIPVDSVERLLEAASVGDTPVSLRDRALFEVLYGAGARISEAVGLDVDDLDLGSVDEPASVRLLGKGDKQRVVPLGRYAVAALDAYLVRARPVLAAGRGTPALFLNQRGARLSRQSAWGALQQAAARADLGGHVSPHTLRHSFATPARRRRGRAGRVGASGARLGDDDPDLHAGQPATPTRGLCRRLPEGSLIGSPKRFQHESGLQTGERAPVTARANPQVSSSPTTETHPHRARCPEPNEPASVRSDRPAVRCQSSRSHRR